MYLEILSATDELLVVHCRQLQVMHFFQWNLGLVQTYTIFRPPSF